MMKISYQLKPAPMELLLCIEANVSRQNAQPVRYQKKKLYLISLVFLVLQIKVFGQPTEAEKYLGETPADLIPKSFAPKIISPKDTYVFGSVFSEKADELFYAVRLDQEWNAELWHVQYKNGKGNKPRSASH